MNRPTHLNSVRLFLAAALSLLLLAGMGLQLITQLGSTGGGIIMVTICVLILTILTPVIVQGPWRDRWLALILVPFPSLILLGVLIFTKSFAR